MDMEILAIAGVFVFLCALLGLVLVYSRLHWVLKAGVIVLSLAAAYGFYVTGVSLKGYPVVVTAVTEARRVIWIQVQEPSAMEGIAGAIHVWIFEGHRPRAITLPYSRETHKNATSALEQIQLGQPVYIGGDGEGGAGKGNATEGEDGGKGDGEGQGGKGVFSFKVKTATLPPKN